MKNLIADTVTGEQREALVKQFGTQLLTGDGVFTAVVVKGNRAVLTTFNELSFSYRWNEEKARWENY